VAGGGVGLALRAALGRGRSRALAVVLAGGLAVIPLAVLASRQARIWESRGTLWLHAVAVAPDCAVCRYNLGTWLLDHGEASVALTHFGEIRARFPDVPRFQGAFGVTLAGLGRYREAEDPLRRAATGLSGPESAVMRLNLAGALIEQNRLEEGLVEVRRALASWPTEAALAHLQRGVASTPRKPVLRLALAEVYEGLGRPTQEAAERAALAELHPALARLAGSIQAAPDPVPGR
jgi:predicted Zn-dependent protease